MGSPLRTYWTGSFTAEQLAEETARSFERSVGPGTDMAVAPRLASPLARVGHGDWCATLRCRGDRADAGQRVVEAAIDVDRDWGLAAHRREEVAQEPVLACAVAAAAGLGRGGEAVGDIALGLIAEGVPLRGRLEEGGLVLVGEPDFAA